MIVMFDWFQIGFMEGLSIGMVIGIGAYTLGKKIGNWILKKKRGQ